MKLLALLAGLAGTMLVSLLNPIRAAELAVPAVSRVPAYCGPCGCLRTIYNYIASCSRPMALLSIRFAGDAHIPIFH
jgi:hypothetical protein